MNIYLPKFNIFDKILKKIFIKYTEKIYRNGVIDGFNWNNNVDKVNDLSTIHKID